MAKLSVPNILTFIRVAIIPFFGVICYLPVLLPKNMVNHDYINLAAATTFAFAGATDWLDGVIARKWGQTTELGAFLDPVADKLLVACALILLVRWDRTFAFLAIIIISREICISALREYMARKNRAHIIAVAKIGKWKTAAQMTAIILLLLEFVPCTRWNLLYPGNGLLIIAVVLTIISFIYYVREIYLDLKHHTFPD